ncbi:hypothetical protein E2P63_04610 [Candidatus Bathyarchaeota archaeon]|nr:hypothetical protein E2P63_04610 [Candidatus Bathyarchaeota archaeon]
MPSKSVKFTLLFILASGLLLAGFFLAWYPHSIIKSLETQIEQGGLTQSELDNLVGSLVWWRNQGLFNYGSAGNFVIATGILVLIYAIVYSVLLTWRESVKAQKTSKKRKISQIKFEENKTAIQYEKTRKTEQINSPIAGGLLTIITSFIIMMFSVVLVIGEIFVNSSQVVTLGVNALMDGAFGIIVSAFAFAGGIMILKRKNFGFAILVICSMMAKGATFVFSTGGDFWGLFIGTDIFVLAVISLIFTSISYKEFS